MSTGASSAAGRRGPNVPPGRGVVFGAPRSGTTFLMSVLNALPAAECVTGNLLPIGIAHLYAQEPAPQTREALERSFRGALAEYLTSGVYHSRSAALRKWWVAGRRPSGLAEAARGRRTETMLIYKEPFLAFAPELAYRALPQARLIYIHRDGRDVANSLVRTYDVLTDEKLADLESNEVHAGRAVDGRYVPWWVAPGGEGAFLQAAPYVRAVWMWREMVRRCREFLERDEVRASGRVLWVRYEDLAERPLEQGRRIVEHLGETLTPRMRRVLGTAYPQSVGSYARRDAGEVLAAEALAGPELLALGYALHARPTAVAEGA